MNTSSQLAHIYALILLLFWILIFFLSLLCLKCINRFYNARSRNEEIAEMNDVYMTENYGTDHPTTTYIQQSSVVAKQHHVILVQQGNNSPQITLTILE